ncbi:MAG: DUF1580 domain-containing protein [Planctomycetes bacterium]|nr:DUF1580 domain-containing protein [Planctomycetota bacterium]
MIDLAAETVLSLSEAARYLPRRRAGKNPHVSTLFRWARDGLRGVRLETIRVGGTLCTSLEALQHFCERLTNPDAARAPCSNSAMMRAAEAAGRELERAGI